MFDYVANNWSVISGALVQHIILSITPLLLGIVIALPLGYLGSRYRWFYTPLLSISSVLYSIPSLALFVVLPLIIGTRVLNPINIVVALTIYTVALLVRVVISGLRSVNPIVTQSATAMGFRRARRLVQVELPMASPVMFAGLRVATVSNISLVSVGALIGVGGLGSLFTIGLQLTYLPPIIVGIVLSVGLAILCDLLIVGIQRLATPWTREGGRK